MLITFDDGYRSLYTRVYPLALAYGFPIVAALVGEWMEPPAGSMVRYGDQAVPRERFISWDQAREMQRSGLVEFALHSQSLHDEVVGNLQGNTMPAAVTRRYSPGTGYQSEADFAAGVRADLAAGRGKPGSANWVARRARSVWPYGRYDSIGTQAARDLGFSFALVLDQDPRPDGPSRLARLLHRHNPPLPDLGLQSLRPDPNERRAGSPGLPRPGQPCGPSNAEASNERLGLAIERVRALGVTGPGGRRGSPRCTGRITAAWFLPGACPWRATGCRASPGR